MMRGVPAHVVFVCSIALSGCAATPPPPPANDAPADIAAIGAARSAFMAAYNAGDAEAIGKLYTADAVSEPNHQPTLSGRDEIVKSLASMFGQVTLKVELKSEETKTTANSGFDRGHYTASVTPKAGGPTTTSEGRYLVLFVKETDGTWRVSRDIDNSATPMAPSASPGTTEAAR
jgi:uncharacterized protein (TIGR02246 family)